MSLGAAVFVFLLAAVFRRFAGGGFVDFFAASNVLFVIALMEPRTSAGLPSFQVDSSQKKTGGRE
jgi:hypothetical protein